MSGDNGGSSDAATRYAAALFELARDAKAVDAVEADLVGFAGLLETSPELAAVLASPAIAADDKARALAAVAEKAGLSDLTRRFLGATAANGRARDIAGAARAYRVMAARHRGVAAAEVTSAAPLSEAQLDALRAALKRVVGRDVEVTTTIAPELLGGLMVKMGSRLYDASLRTKLDGLAQAMKGG